jgi:predicted DNA-binding transcriptional regulator AlpA
MPKLKKQQPISMTIPAALLDVALLDAKTCAAVGSMGISWWYEEVAAGRAPQPAVRKTRGTRWRLADVRKFWLDWATADNTAEANERMVVARKASAAAQAKRKAIIIPPLG